MEGSARSLAPPVSTVATSSARNKVSLKPGRSLMDWIRFTNSVKDLTSTGGKLLEVSPRELAKHNTTDDAWIALRGKVYNVTHYLEYHPGGEEELMRGVGKDATELFNQVHRWVNVESMLQKCLVGVLKKSWSMEAPKFPHIKPFKSKIKKQIPALPSDVCSNEKSDECKEVCENANKLKTEWSVLPSSDTDLNEMFMRFDEYEDSLKLQISSSYIKQDGLITDLVERMLFVKINNSRSYFLKIALSDSYQEHYKVAVEDGSKVEFSFKRNFMDKLKNLTLNSRDSVKCIACDPQNEIVYWNCKLINKTPINYNTYLFTFLLPPGTKMWIPIGCHVQMKYNIEGIDVVRCYTPICSSLNPKLNNDDKLDGSKIVFMIKCYSSGSFTSSISRFNLGDNISISNYTGNFLMNFVEHCDSIIMLAAGTGLTPMIRIIYWAITDEHVKRSLQLLFFNKTEEDILWRQELETCKSTYDEFQIDHILSEPSPNWNGYTGNISEDLLKQLIRIKSTLTNQRFLVCGPLAFVEKALSFLKEIGFNQDDMYAFTGFNEKGNFRLDT